MTKPILEVDKEPSTTHIPVPIPIPCEEKADTNEGNKDVKDATNVETKKTVDSDTQTEFDDVSHIETNSVLCSFIDRFPSIWNSILLNKVYYITLSICLGVFAWYDDSTSFLYAFHKTVSSYMLVTFWGWYIHYISHYCNISELYKYYRNTHSLKFDMKHTFDYIVYNVYYYMCDFHHIVHHDSSVNKTLQNRTIEFLTNIWFQGILFFFVAIILGIYSSINWNIVILWAMVYTTTHNINFEYVKPLCHQQHHKNERTNYGIDTIDVIMGTKYDISCLEDFNHMSLNVFCFTICILYASKKLTAKAV